LYLTRWLHGYAADGAFPFYLVYLFLIALMVHHPSASASPFDFIIRHITDCPDPDAPRRKLPIPFTQRPLLPLSHPSQHSYSHREAVRFLSWATGKGMICCSRNKIGVTEPAHVIRRLGLN
jgi:hypothetical protein